MTAQFDFLIIGDDEPSLCAAACAQRAGASVALVRPAKSKTDFAARSLPNIPNFIWRRLDLQDFGLTVEKTSARVTLFGEGDPVVTFSNPRETKTALSEAGFTDAVLWEDFVADANSLADSGFINESASGAKNGGAVDLAKMLGDRTALHRAAQLAGSSRSLLDDCFEDERLKDHILAHALSPSGLSGAEPGSAFALTDYFDEDGWRVRANGDGKSLHEILTIVCENAGVVTFTKPIEKVFADSAKFTAVVFDDEEKIKTRRVFFATPDAAAIAGAGHCAPGASMRGSATATAAMRFKLSEKIEPPAHDKNAIFQIIDSSADLQEASDDALSGRLPERLPVEFEISEEGDILARSSFLPASFYEDGEWRSWTSQDRQAAAIRIRERLSERLPGLANSILKATVDISGVYEAENPYAQCSGVVVQPHRHNAISAAVRLIDRIMTSDS